MRPSFCFAGLLFACGAHAPPRASAPSPVAHWLAEAKAKRCASTPLSITYSAEDPNAREAVSLRCDAKGALVDVATFEPNRPAFSVVEYPLETSFFESIWKSVLARVDERGCITRQQAVDGAVLPKGGHVVGISAGEPVACVAPEAWNATIETIRAAGADARVRYPKPAADCCKGEPPCVMSSCW